MNLSTSTLFYTLAFLLASAPVTQAMHKVKHLRHVPANGLHYAKHHPLATAGLTLAGLAALGAFYNRKEIEKLVKDNLLPAGCKFKAQHPFATVTGLGLATVATAYGAVKSGLAQWSLIGLSHFIKDHKVGTALGMGTLVLVYLGDKNGLFEGVKVKLKLKDPVSSPTKGDGQRVPATGSPNPSEPAVNQPRPPAGAPTGATNS